MKTVVIAGATGYLGSYLVAHYKQLGWAVRALVRNEATARAKGLDATEFFEGEATKPNSMTGLMENADLVVSALGITRQKADSPIAMWITRRTRTCSILPLKTVFRSSPISMF